MFECFCVSTTKALLLPQTLQYNCIWLYTVNFIPMSRATLLHIPSVYTFIPSHLCTYMCNDRYILDIQYALWCVYWTVAHFDKTYIPVLFLLVWLYRVHVFPSSEAWATIIHLLHPKSRIHFGFPIIASTLLALNFVQV